MVRLAKAAGSPVFVFTNPRHQAITEMSQAGVSDATLITVAGHFDRSITAVSGLAAKRDVLPKLESGLMEIPMTEDKTKNPGQS